MDKDSITQTPMNESKDPQQQQQPTLSDSNKDNREQQQEGQELSVNVTNYRRLVRDYMDLQDYQTALFWADKVCAFTNNDPRDVYNVAQCMYSLNEFHRASEVIKEFNLHRTNMMCHYLSVRCLVQAKMYAEALDLLNSIDAEQFMNVVLLSDQSFDDRQQRVRIGSLLHFLRGQVFEALDNRVLACECYRQALQMDVHCYEAFNSLIQHQMLTAAEEKQMINALPFVQQCNNESEVRILRTLYEGALKKFHSNVSDKNCFATKDELQQDSGGDGEVNKMGDFEMQQDTIAELKKICGIKTTTATANKKGSKSSNWSTSVHVSLLQNQSVVNNPTKMSSMTWSFNNKLSSTATSTSMMTNIGGGNKAKINDMTSGDCTSNQNQTDNQLNAYLIPLDEGLKRLELSSFDVLVSKAETHFYNCRYKQCVKLTEAILKKDPFHVGCLKVHISCLSEMCNYNKLFYLAHKLVDMYPDKAISWYAVGCYYYIIGKSDPARRYLAKATSLDKLLGPAWLAYGHSFGVENEHDQAMAAYFKASQLMRGCHLPMLYIGLECGLTNNNKLAEKFFQQAEKIAPEDPFVIHEMGVIAFHNQDYDTAERKFREALTKVSAGDCLVNECWETLINNLGHACRKNGKLRESLDFHRQALKIDPQNPNTYSAIGFVQALMQDTLGAVDSFHIALGLRRDDTFSTTMLSQTIEQLMDDNLGTLFDDDASNTDNNQQQEPSDDMTKQDGGGFEAKGVKLREGVSGCSGSTDTANVKILQPPPAAASVLSGTMAGAGDGGTSRQSANTAAAASGVQEVLPLSSSTSVNNSAASMSMSTSGIAGGGGGGAGGSANETCLDDMSMSMEE